MRLNRRGFLSSVLGALAFWRRPKTGVTHVITVTPGAGAIGKRYAVVTRKITLNSSFGKFGSKSWPSLVAYGEKI